MAGTPKSERERKPMGLEVDRADREEADRIAAAAGLKPSQVLRMAISAGLPAVARRLLEEPIATPPTERQQAAAGGEQG